MSDRERGRASRPQPWRTALAAALACVAVEAAGAQSAADYRRQLDALEPQWRAARAAVEAKEAARRSAARSMPLDRGVFRLDVDSALLPLLLEPVDAAAGMMDATFGDAARLVAQRRLTVRAHSTRRGGDTVRAIRIGTPGREASIALGDPSTTRSHLIAALTGPRITGVIHASADDSVRSWIRSPLAAGRESAADRERIYVELVTASTDISRRCLAGEVLGCRQLLSFAPVNDPLVDGLTAVQRRMTVAGRGAQLRTPGRSREYDRCVVNHDDEACIAQLRGLPPDMFARSIASTDMHRSFIRFVIDRGGAHAWDRLSAAEPLPLEARFAEAGRAPLDSLILAWRSDILAARPARTPVTPTAALSTLAWIVLTGGIALRSSRWR